MKKRFIIALDKSTPEQNEAFKNFIDAAAGINWWHWISNVWLIIDEQGKWGSSQLRDKVREFYSGETMFVVELRPDDDTWSGFGPKGQQQNMFTWLENNWKK
jgi:hypothetical protein